MCLNFSYPCSQRRNLSDNWRGVYSYIHLMPDGFLLKSTQIQKKSGRRAEHEYMNKHPPPPLPN